MRNRHDRRALAWAAGAIAITSACTTTSSEFEDYRDSLPRVEGMYIVEGDLPIHSEDALRSYYDERMGDFGSTEQSLAINLFNGHDDTYNPGTNLQLTYCVSTSFNTTSTPNRHDDIVSTIALAALRWEQIVHVNFTHASAHDGNCTDTNGAVWFNIRPSASVSGMVAWFPHEPRIDRKLLVGPSVSSGTPAVELATHELGHMLGFRHEFDRPDSVINPICRSTAPLRPITSYDTGSVMHYPANDPFCAGTTFGYKLSRRDKIGAQRIYGPNSNTCSILAMDTCSAHGASCSVAYSVTGARHDLCRWIGANSQSSCGATRGGIWTSASSSFAQVWPTAVPAGAAGACITQLGNLGCSASDADLCLLHDASCERAFSTSGVRRDLCRWHNNATTAQCTGTGGIWTSATSSFAQIWPTAVPAGAAGACITQVQNL